MSTTRLTAAQINTQLVDITDGISILPKDVGATEDGSAVDCTGVSYALAVLTVAAASVSTDFTFLVEKSPDGSSGWVNVAAGEIDPGQPAVINDDAAGNHNKTVSAIVKIDATKAFLRWSVTGTGGTPALIASGAIIKGATLKGVSPYQLDQVLDVLSRRNWDRGGESPPTDQASIGTILA
ncbi:hypothetical protein LCGC14_2560040 [marine sediment metagenome]|uniref:Uncharacterized protein n=1 Tax=marine sediment metagenome TaxID=412755 RepID=A0A0F9B860_9ZZZZ